MDQSKKASLFLPLFCAYLGHIIWGLGNIFTKIALENASGEVVLAHRFLLATVLMLGWMLIKKRPFSFRGKNFGAAFLLVSMQVLYYVFETYGIEYTNASVSGVVLAVVPVVAMIIAAIFLKEYPTRRQAIFCFFPIAGVILLTLSASAEGAIQKPVGILFLILCCCCSAIYKNANRKASESFDSFERSLLVIAASATVFTVWSALKGDLTVSGFVAPLKVPSYLLAVLVLGLLCSLAANLLVNFAVSRMQVVKLSSFGAVSTLVTILSGVLDGEPMTLWIALGAGLILWGVYQVTKPTEKNVAEEKTNV